MIPTSIGTLQVGSPWLSRQWISSIPGVAVTTGITQNNLTIRAGNHRPTFTTGQSAFIPSGGTGGGGGGTGGGTGGGGGGGDDGGGYTYF
jgi:hypothetical protein